MFYKLVNVTGVRDLPFTAELIVPSDGLFQAVVGIFEDSDEGNIAPGVSIYSVWDHQYEETDQEVFRNPASEETQAHTPQLV